MIYFKTCFAFHRNLKYFTKFDLMKLMKLKQQIVEREQRRLLL